MKYLKSWLEDYVEIERSDEALAQIITRLGFETEVEKSGENKIVVGEILEIRPHPNANHLRLARVDTGRGEAEVVCGAPNIEVGQKVPCAGAGVEIQGRKLEAIEIRGVKSNGMLLSEYELGLGDDHSGIKILEKELEAGSSFDSVDGAVFDVEVTPNRGDVLSHLGLARELMAYDGKSLKAPQFNVDESKKPATGASKVEIKSKNCNQYFARVIDGVKIASSPDWLKARLEKVGIKPINNVVDVTNYVMYDLGQPLHAFDASKIGGNKIIVRDIEKNEEVVSLDGAARGLLPGMMVIADEVRPVAIAGVIGLKNSEVDDQTTKIVLEAADFDRRSVRLTAKLLGLRTEASYRFERGIDSNSIEYALHKAAKMIAEICGGKVMSGVISARRNNELGIKNKELKIEYEKINDLIGIEYSREAVDKILLDLGFEIKGGAAQVPSWRHDIEVWGDLAEEVSRIDGIDKIKPVPMEANGGAVSKNSYHAKETIKERLRGMGLSEVLTYTFLSDEDISAAKIDTANLLEVANPVQDENRYLRNSLVPGLLKSIARNPSFDDIEIFELGRVFTKSREKENLAVATSGKSVRDAQAVIDELAKKLGVKLEGACVYDISRDELMRFKIKKPKVSIAEVELEEFLDGVRPCAFKAELEAVKYRPISKFPPVSRDLAFVVDKDLDKFEIRNLILGISPKAVLVDPFDEFVDEKFGKGKKSVAFHLWLEDQDKTLSDAEADSEIKKIIDALKDKFGAELRG